jgi:hypothetical protein
VVNLTIRQRHLKVTDASVSDVGSGQFKRLKIDQPLEMHQPSIGDFGAREIQISELSQLFELYESSVRDFGAAAKIHSTDAALPGPLKKPTWFGWVCGIVVLHFAAELDECLHGFAIFTLLFHHFCIILDRGQPEQGILDVRGPWWWLLSNIRRVTPMPWRGQQKLFNGGSKKGQNDLLNRSDPSSPFALYSHESPTPEELFSNKYRPSQS